MEQNLKGKRVAVLMTDGVEQVEYTQPRAFLEERGAQVTLLSPKQSGENFQGFNNLDHGDTFTVDAPVAGANPVDYHGLLLPGGVANPDSLRLAPDAIAFIKAMADANKPIGAICHGPWTLIDAGVATSRHMTSWPSLQTDLRNAGAEWTDDEVVVDDRLVTSRKPADIPAFNEAFMKQVAMEGEEDIGPSS